MVRVFAKVISVLMPTKLLRKRIRRHIEISFYTLLARRRTKFWGEGSIMTYKGNLSKQTNVGCGTSLSSISVLGGGNVRIGNHVSTGPNLIIQTQNHDYKGESLPYGAGWVYKDVEIGDAVWIGMNVLILPGTKIGEGAIIQAGSVVHGEIPPCAIAGGNPAKVFAWRDKEHYEKLKAQGSYFNKNID
jgi:acetyltransferase-like isoleucine patch superfamily enzyme